MLNKRIQQDVSTAYKFTPRDKELVELIMPHEATPQAIIIFNNHKKEFSNYAYWFVLSTLWVSYTGYSDLNLWRELFSSTRPNKAISLMKPSELKELAKLPNKLIVYRAHRDNETDNIAYTLDYQTAQRFARERHVDEVKAYRVKKRDVLALFLRRGESEIIVLDKSKAVSIQLVF